MNLVIILKSLNLILTLNLIFILDYSFKNIAIVFQSEIVKYMILAWIQVKYLWQNQVTLIKGVQIESVLPDTSLLVRKKDFIVPLNFVSMIVLWIWVSRLFL